MTRKTKIRLSVRKVTADSVSGWLKKILRHNQHTAIVGGKIYEIQFFGLRTLSIV